MILFSVIITPRLQYITEFIAQEMLGEGFQLTDDVEIYKAYNGAKINYSADAITSGEFSLKPCPLLFETGVRDQSIVCSQNNNYKAFFATSGDFSFDIFAASFYLLSRYEEYLSYEKDMYGRYAFENSLAYKEGFLNLPLVNIWLKDFCNVLIQKFPAIKLRQRQFSFIPTYDIDMAWSYKHKGPLRNLGGYLKDLFTGDWKMFNERLRVLSGKEMDPFDSFGWMNKLHEKYHLKPYYFFLLAARKARYDKNIDPTNKAMQALIADHLIRYPVGIHPSWQSGDDTNKLATEISTLAKITGNAVTASRQHYIRFTLPDTYRVLIEKGIRFDFSMGYGSINGFRASVASAFYWYDLEKEMQTELLLFPFCYMEANSFYEQQDTPQQALAEMIHYNEQVKAIDGLYMMIWHNSFLGTASLYKGWREVYEEFIKKTSS